MKDKDASDKVTAWEQAGRIRKGEGELPDFEVINAWIARAPATWIPALLRQCVACAVVKEVFQPGRLLSWVMRCEEIANDPNSMLRKDETP